MRHRSILAVLLPTTLAVLAAASPALGAGPGATFLISGLDLPAGAIPGGSAGVSIEGSTSSSLSSDGRYVAFVSSADVLDAAANLNVANVFRKDRLTGAVVLVSRAAGASGAAPAASSVDPAISDDGSRVAFGTRASLDPADTDGGQFDVYVRDLANNTTTLASQGNGGAQTTDTPSTLTFDLSGSGRHVVFTTDAALDAANDGNAQTDVYRRDLALGTTTLVSKNASGARAADAASADPSISDDGAWVAFTSQADDVVAGYVGAGRQAYVRDVGGAGTAHLVSPQSGTTLTGANGDASEPDVAGAPASGHLENVAVAFTSKATNGAAGDTQPARSVYLWRQSTGALLASSGRPGVNADRDATDPAVSDDGTRVVFTSGATNLGAGEDFLGVYLRDLGNGTTTLVSAHNNFALFGTISGDGGYVAWFEPGGATADSDADLAEIFGRGAATPTAPGPIELLSRPAGSAPFLAAAFSVFSFDFGVRAISADGRYVALAASSSHLPGTDGGQILRRDTLTGALELVSRAPGAGGAPADHGADEPSISADGTRVAFQSRAANLDPVATGSNDEVFVRDLATGATTLVSRAEGPDGAPGDGFADAPVISSDGRHVGFRSGANNLVAGAIGLTHAYVRDVPGGHLQLVDRATGPDGAIGSKNAFAVATSGDGRYVAFSTDSRLDPDDADTLVDIYVRDTVAQTTTLVSRQSGLAGAKATTDSENPTISADGRVVAFETRDERLAPEGGAWAGRTEVVARTLATGANALVSRAPSGTVANADARGSSVDGDGSVIAFQSTATNVLPGLGGESHSAVFARTMASGALSGPPAFGLALTDVAQGSSDPSISDDGQCIAFRGTGHNAVTGFAGDFTAAYVYVVSGSCPKSVPGDRRASAPKPSLTRASLTHKRFRVGRRATARAAVIARVAAPRRGKRRAPVGTAFRFALNVRAKVTIAIERPAAGRLVGRFCRRPAHRLRRHLRCVRFVSVGKLVRNGLGAGKHSVAFSGRIGRKALKPGAYRARLRATNADGASRWVRLSFKVVR